MKQTLMIITLCVMAFFSNAQEASVERSVFGVDMGFIGLWGYNEAKLSNQVTLRSEIGLRSSFAKGLNVTFRPVVSTGPRWYFDLNKRANQSKNISGNSASFVGMDLKYLPDYNISTRGNHLQGHLLVAEPNIGIRRALGEHFSFETGAGVMFLYAIQKGPSNQTKVYPSIRLRIGYRF